MAPEHDDGVFALNFDEPIKWDLADALAALPETLQSIETVRVDHSAVVRFKLNGSPQVRTFRDGQSFVVDVGQGSMKAKDALAAGAAQLAATAPDAPAIAPPETVPAEAAKPAAAPKSTAGWRRRAAHGRHAGAGRAEGRAGRAAAETAGHDAGGSRQNRLRRMKVAAAPKAAGVQLAPKPDMAKPGILVGQSRKWPSRPGTAPRRRSRRRTRPCSSRSSPLRRRRLCRSRPRP